MKERPIIFNSEMVKALLDGRKTQTRRPIKPQPPTHCNDSYPIISENAGIISHCFYKRRKGGGYYKKCPFGFVGNRLWVRETFVDIKGELAYKADDVFIGCWKWKPSIHMPRWASRITLEITDVRVERVQYMTQEDLIAEGIMRLLESPLYYSDRHGDFKNLWNSIYKNWDDNPWVWVVSFKII